MGQIIKFPVQAAKLGYKRVKKRGGTADANQLPLFSQPLGQILTLSPELGWFEQALMLDERGDLRAAESYAKAIEQQDCVADAYCNLGILESQTGNAIKAFDCFTTSLKQDPRHLEAHYNLANLYFEANDLRLAQIHYEMAAEIDSAFANVHFNLALVQAMNNELAAAVLSLTRYRDLVGEEDQQHADELLHNLKRSLDAQLGASDVS